MSKIGIFISIVMSTITGGGVPDTDNILLEDGSNLLTEDGFLILID